MKHPNDTLTQELPGLEETPKAPALYRVYCATTEGAVLVWTNLTKAKALVLYRAMDKNFSPLQSSTDITRFGWEEMK